MEAAFSVEIQKHGLSRIKALTMLLEQYNVNPWPFHPKPDREESLHYTWAAFAADVDLVDTFTAHCAAAGVSTGEGVRQIVQRCLDTASGKLPATTLQMALQEWKANEWRRFVMPARYSDEAWWKHDLQTELNELFHVYVHLASRDGMSMDTVFDVMDRLLGAGAELTDELRWLLPMHCASGSLDLKNHGLEPYELDLLRGLALRGASLNGLLALAQERGNVLGLRQLNTVIAEVRANHGGPHLDNARQQVAPAPTRARL